MQCRNYVRKTRCLQDPEAFKQYRVASGAGQHTQGATQYTRDVYKQCGMQMPALQESFWRQKEKRRSDDGAYKAQFQRKRKQNEKTHAARIETVKQERQDNKSGKTYGSGVALRGEHEETRKKEGMSAIIVAAMIIKGKAAHSVHSMQAKCILVLVLECVRSLIINYLLWILYPPTPKKMLHVHPMWPVRLCKTAQTRPIKCW